MINVVNITQHYGVRPILRNVSLRVEPGELLAVMGPNGTGKSTLLKVVAGVLWPQEGHVEVNGLRRRASEADELAIRRQVVYLPDQAFLPARLTGREFLMTVGHLYGIADTRLMDHIDRLLVLFDMGAKADSAMGGYSTGQRKKIGLCSALVTEAPIMLLDEPFAGGLDPSGILALERVLQRLVKERGVTVMMATPVPELVEAISTRIAVIKDGGLFALDTAAGLRARSGCDGPLQEVLERLVEPKTLQHIDEYFQGQAG